MSDMDRMLQELLALALYESEVRSTGSGNPSWPALHPEDKEGYREMAGKIAGGNIDEVYAYAQKGK